MIVAILSLFLPGTVLSFCYQCSLLSHVGNKCDPSYKYTDLLPAFYDGSTDNLLLSGSLCAVISSSDGLVFHRGNLRAEDCRSAQYRDRMALMFGKLNLPGGGGAVVTCCSASGCNWNITTASKNLSLDKVK